MVCTTHKGGGHLPNTGGHQNMRQHPITKCFTWLGSLSPIFIPNNYEGQFVVIKHVSSRVRSDTISSDVSLYYMLGAGLSIIKGYWDPGKYLIYIQHHVFVMQKLMYGCDAYFNDGTIFFIERIHNHMSTLLEINKYNAIGYHILLSVYE